MKLSSLLIMLLATNLYAANGIANEISLAEAADKSGIILFDQDIKYSWKYHYGTNSYLMSIDLGTSKGWRCGGALSGISAAELQSISTGDLKLPSQKKGGEEGVGFLSMGDYTLESSTSNQMTSYQCTRWETVEGPGGDDIKECFENDANRPLYTLKWTTLHISLNQNISISISCKKQVDGVHSNAFSNISLAEFEELSNVVRIP